MPLYVSKFGGTSLADGRCFLKVASIVRQSPHRRVVVVSAPGRRFAGDEKVTDLLYAFAGGDASAWARAADRFLEISRFLNIDARGLIKNEEAHIAAGADVKYIASIGEYLSARILARALGFAFIDAAECVRITDGRADERATIALMREAIDPNRGSVIPGFYGSDESGARAVFPRGGSDITGAYAARAMSASLYENWTDVDGVYDEDPAECASARLLARISYNDMKKLCERGACVVHKDCLPPVEQAGIPILVKNTFNPDAEGTYIADSLSGAFY